MAQYTSMNFPNYLKTTSLYDKGDIQTALEEAFLGFDATLTEESVIRQLKDLAGVENENEEIDEEGMWSCLRSAMLDETKAESQHVADMFPLAVILI